MTKMHMNNSKEKNNDTGDTYSKCLLAENTIRKIMPLAGTWSCRLDPHYGGLRDNWQNTEIKGCMVTLPGTTQTNGIGPAYAVELISDLTPATEYIGPAWYQHEVELTEADCKRHVELFLERCGWLSAAWLNGIPLGQQDSLVSPHVYDLGGAVMPGSNRLTIMIDNSNRKTEAAVSRSDGSQAEDLVLELDSHKRFNCGGHHAVFGGPCWNGITGRMEIIISEQKRIVDLQVYPDVARGKARVAVTVASDSDTACPASLTFEIQELRTGTVAASMTSDIMCVPGRSALDHVLAFDGAVRLWDEFTPELYRLSVTLRTLQGEDTCATEFGMRHISQVGTCLAINGRPAFLRGALECFVHPLTGYAPTDLDTWLQIFGMNKAHGLNHVRFHTCCPPEAAFAAADRLGIILNIELPGCSGSEPDDSATLNYLQDEALRILRRFGNHPSFCMLTMGNELLCGEEGETKAQEVLVKRVAKCREVDSRHWYCCTAHAHTEGRTDDYYVSAWPKGATVQNDGEPITGIRWSGFDVVDSSRFNTRPPETASDYRAGIAGINKPVITHEVGQWAVYPDIREAGRYTGVFKAFNLETIKSFMEVKGTLPLADEFVDASGKLSLLLYKEEIESALRTPGLAGFQLLGFHDHPPQGTSTIGIVTALRESKGIVTASEFQQFCSETVPLARLTQRTFLGAETLSADIEVAHFGREALGDAEFKWHLRTASGEEIAGGPLGRAAIPSGALTRLGRIEVPLFKAPAPAKAVLTVFAAGTRIKNTWDIWIYPETGDREETRVKWRRGWSPEVAAEVAAGAVVILELPQAQIPGATRGCLTSVFWNPIMKRNQKSFTLGVLCDPRHPALADFPTEAHSNWQWWDVLRPSRVLDLDGMAPRPTPIVRMIDSFIYNRCLCLLFEAKMGKGRLIVTSLDLSSALHTRHAARQLRKSLEAYVSSNAFNPAVELRAKDMDDLVAYHQEPLVKETREAIKARLERPISGN